MESVITKRAQPLFAIGSEFKMSNWYYSMHLNLMAAVSETSVWNYLLDSQTGQNQIRTEDRFKQAK